VSEETGKPPQETPFDREELFHLLVDSAVDFAILTTDPAGIVTSWNVGGEHLLGFTRDEILGTSADVIFTPEERAEGVPDLERAKAKSEGRAEDERWHLRKDGSRLWGSGLMMPLRGTSGFLKIMRDRTRQRLAEERLIASENRFRILATNIPQLVFRCEPDGARNWASPQWETYSGLTDEQSRKFGWLEAIHPDERQLTLNAWRDAEMSGRYAVEHRIRRRSDDSYRWHKTLAGPAPAGETVEWVGTSTDIQDLRSLHERQQVLLAELQHRTRNLLALVQAIARRTMRRSQSLADFTEEYESRLMALSRVQGLVSSTSQGTLDLRTLVEAELKAHISDDQNKVSIEGPPVELSMASVQILALALHELATNSVKYGAIGQSAGTLALRWWIRDGDDHPKRVTIEWRETGVAMPDAATLQRKGYGSELIERALPYQLDAETSLEMLEDGVRCLISVPIAPA
jgi:PAS domain S-box-containing protein